MHAAAPPNLLPKVPPPTGVEVLPSLCYYSEPELSESPPVNQSKLPIQIGKNQEEPLKYSILSLEIFSKIVVEDHRYFEIYEGVIVFKLLN
ncbi:hypothetical protein TorRG33x02_083160 [Trema orientale]|uniref:Uncharacterized protein n=1 Tax=Trema orientale TaxID=63057 RepID=A0A2P5FDC5_TREOI|nr:hypothetical protein TorRG33x02_083160 [Trema orientale]